MFRGGCLWSSTGSVQVVPTACHILPPPCRCLWGESLRQLWSKVVCTWRFDSSLLFFGCFDITYWYILSQLGRVGIKCTNLNGYNIRNTHGEALSCTVIISFSTVKYCDQMLFRQNGSLLQHSLKIRDTSSCWDAYPALSHNSVKSVSNSWGNILVPRSNSTSVRSILHQPTMIFAVGPQRFRASS